MALNPHSATLMQAGRAAARAESGFRARADATLTACRLRYQELRKQVERGQITPSNARDQASRHAAELEASLLQEAAGYTGVHRVFQSRLAEASTRRRAEKAQPSLEALQRETNRLLQQSLVEQQLQSREAEFEKRSFMRPLNGGTPAPTLGSLLALHEEATRAGDSAGQEWARRKLETLRFGVHEAQDQRRIDAACDRPDRVNPRTISRYLEALADSDVAERARFASEAVAAGDSNACFAAFLLARSDPSGSTQDWVRNLLGALDRFPDAALNALGEWEAEAQGVETRSAQDVAEFACAQAREEARLAGVAAPTDAQLARQSRMAARPVAAADQPIGLVLQYRGHNPEEIGVIGLDAGAVGP